MLLLTMHMHVLHRTCCRRACYNVRTAVNFHACVWSKLLKWILDDILGGIMSSKNRHHSWFLGWWVFHRKVWHQESL